MARRQAQLDRQRQAGRQTARRWAENGTHGPEIGPSTPRGLSELLLTPEEAAVVESRGNPDIDWSYPGKFKQIQAYGDAKLLALMYTYAQARHYEGEGLTFNAVSPGAVKTTLGSKAGGPFKLIQALTNPFVGPPEKGSRGCVRLMADPELATATGGYYSSAKLNTSSKQSQDVEGQERIYAQTERELRAHA